MKISKKDEMNLGECSKQHCSTDKRATCYNCTTCAEDGSMDGGRARHLSARRGSRPRTTEVRGVEGRSLIAQSC